MQRYITISEEAMDEAEVVYLAKMRDEQLPLLYRTIRIFAILCVTLPCILGIVMLLFRTFSPRIPRPANEPPPNILLVCFLGFLGLAFVIGISTYISYTNTLGKIIKDIREKRKIVERSEVVSKRHMKENNTFHFYITSPTRLSIEVDKADYDIYREGDEINIEYGKVSKTYLGYF